jgi:hypothetical protein
MSQPVINPTDAMNKLVEHVKRGECILFLGAGVNVASQDDRFPYPEKHRPLQAKSLAKKLIEGTQYHEMLPGASEEDLQKASLYIDVMLSRQELAERLKKHLRDGKYPSHALRMLAALPFPIIITTNYDDLLETALAQAGKRVVKHIYEPRPTVGTKDLENTPPPDRPVVFKIHGDLDEPLSIVVTDEDYIKFVHRMTSREEAFNPVPLEIRYRLSRQPTLFIGYSLLDYNLRLLFRTLRSPADRTFPNAYAIDMAPDPLILDVWQNRDRIVTFFVHDLWHFIPWLYCQVQGEEYRP